MSDELRHYGVKGMRWGVRRYQNYDGSLTAAGKARYGHSKRTYASPQRRGNAVRNVVSDLLSRIRPSRTQTLETDYTRTEGQYEKLSQLKRKVRPSPPEDDALKANPRYEHQPGKIENCTFCVSAMELRRRGYDVIARSRATAAPANIFKNWFKGAKLSYIQIMRREGESRKEWASRSYARLTRRLERQGPGASGALLMYMTQLNAGHAVYYWVGEDGKVRFYDGQSGKSGENLNRLFAIADPEEYVYYRLDHLELDDRATESVRSNPQR